MPGADLGWQQSAKPIGGVFIKSIIFPGEVITRGQRRLPGTYIEGENTIAATLFISDGSSVIPLEGSWAPRRDDIVVGSIESVRNNVYSVSLSHFGRGLIIGGKYERYSFMPGDVIEAKVKDVEDRSTVILSYPKPLQGGVTVSIKPSKVPRVIGKENTMVNQISELTETRIVAGKNGLVWIKGRHVPLAMMAISIIEGEAHTSGLTNRIRVLLENELNKK